MNDPVRHLVLCDYLVVEHKQLLFISGYGPKSADSLIKMLSPFMGAPTKMAGTSPPMVNPALPVSPTHRKFRREGMNPQLLISFHSTDIVKE